LLSFCSPFLSFVDEVACHWDAQRDARKQMRSRRSSIIFHGEHEPCNNAAVLALLEGNNADTPYDKESYTRNSETSPPDSPADHYNEEKTEQQKQPQ